MKTIKQKIGVETAVDELYRIKYMLHTCGMLSSRHVHEIGEKLAKACDNGEAKEEKDACAKILSASMHISSAQRLINEAYVRIEDGEREFSWSEFDHSMVNIADIEVKHLIDVLGSLGILCGSGLMSKGYALIASEKRGFSGNDVAGQKLLKVGRLMDEMLKVLKEIKINTESEEG